MDRYVVRWTWPSTGVSGFYTYEGPQYDWPIARSAEETANRVAESLRSLGAEVTVTAKGES